MIFSSSIKRLDIYLVLAISGLLGFFFGSTGGCSWQGAVEGAQVIAGLVHYPAANPFFMYQVKTWTVLHQFLAILLRMGLSEKTLSLFMSGAAGAFSFQALSLLTFSISRNRWMAILAALFISHTSIYAFGTVYPVSLMGPIATYGMVGMAWMMMTFALLSLGEDALGGWMLGIAPAIHPVLGLFTWMVTLAAGWFERAELKKRLNSLSWFFLLGCFCAFISWMNYQWKVNHWLPQGMTIDKTILSAFVKSWDGHRGSVPLNSEDIYFNLVALGMAWAWLSAFKADLLPEARFLLRVFIVSAALGMMAMIMTWIPIGSIPWQLVAMMPGRILSINIFGFGPLLIGLADRYRGNRTADIFLSFFLVGILSWTRVTSVNFHVLLFLLMASAVFLFSAKWFGWISVKVSHEGKNAPNLFLRGAIFLAMGMSLTANFFHVRRIFPERYEAMKDWTNDALYSAIAQHKDSLLLIGADLGPIQLLTRRPVVIDVSAMDGMVYIPEAGSATYEIMKEIYGVDLMRLAQGTIVNQALFERRSVEEWIRLAKKYQFTEVLVDRAWNLKLPEVISKDPYTLYAIPDYGDGAALAKTKA
ncbi:MAG: hypothetical protein EXS63_09275 [Candidatus Omnitrophica bacterium]|nr:hypothetical protein [Candidatus Omnitrophota bacterium]